MNKFGDLVFGCECGRSHGFGKAEKGRNYKTSIRCKKCGKRYDVEIKDGQFGKVTEAV